MVPRPNLGGNSNLFSAHIHLVETYSPFLRRKPLRSQKVRDQINTFERLEIKLKYNVWDRDQIHSLSLKYFITKKSILFKKNLFVVHSFGTIDVSHLTIDIVKKEEENNKFSNRHLTTPMTKFQNLLLSYIQSRNIKLKKK